MIERLSSATDAGLERVGGKSAGLVRLLSAGLDVPEAWVIPAPVSLDDTQRRQCLGTELATWWHEASQLFPTARWAVRSSAVAEDLEGTSFAGVYETVLGVHSLKGIRAAVQHAWAAIDGERAASYLGENGIDAGSGIALVLQRMVDADTAGVMLTENPLRPFDDSIVIDASWGLGESVVSGKTDPDHLVLQRSTGEILSQRIGAKAVEIVYADGLLERAVSDERAEVRCLDEADVQQLWSLATMVGERIGERRDLEWAIEDGRLYVLQDRPITGLPPREPREVWTRRFGDEYLADYTSRLGYDLMVPWLTEVQMDETSLLSGRTATIGMEKLRRHNGYVYLNGDYILDVARTVPVDAREGQMTSLFDETFVRRILAVKYEPVLLIKSLRAPSKDKGRGPVKANLAAMKTHCASIDEHLAPRLSQDYTALSDEEWRRQYDEMNAYGENHFRIIRWGMGTHPIVLQAMLKGMLAKWVGQGAADDVQSLISGLPGTMTAQINREVWDLGLLARTDEGVLAALRSDLSCDEARRATPASEFWGAFDAFLARHGHRSSTREVAEPRWREQPEVVLGLVRAQLRPETPGTGPEEFERRAEDRRIEVEREILDAVGRGPLGGLRRRLFTRVLGQVQALTVYRENQRYHLDYLQTQARQLLLEQGRRLVGRGLLAQREDVFLLSGTTFWHLVDSPPSSDTDALRAEVVAEVEDSRQHRERHVSKLPASYLFDGVPTEGRVEAPGEAAEGVLVGVGASAGTATGPARVVRSLGELSQVEVGDVLVASNIDPGWTSVFPLLAALVTETGGVLSHGAILAREYGIPTVTCVDAALQHLETGDVVRVDGSAGTVEAATRVDA